MKELGRFCTETQMFVENPAVKTKTLEFNRWLAEKQGKTVSEPLGQFALAIKILNSSTPENGAKNS